MPQNSNFSVPLLISLVIHVGAIAALAVSVDFDKKPPALPQASSEPKLKAVVVDSKAVAQKVAEIRKQKADAAKRERDRQAELQRKLDAARKARQKEQDRIKKLEQQRKQKQAEAAKASAAARAAKLKEQQEKQKAAAAEKVRKQKELEQRAAEKAAKAAAIKRKKEELAAQKAEAERKRKEAEARKKREAEAARKKQEDDLAKALQAEQAALSKTRSRQVLSEVAKYKALITQTIKRNLVVDPSMNGKTCRVNIRLAQDGFVISSKTIGGDSVVCRATKTAITKAGRLPISPDANVYEQMKNINLEVSPEFN
ncbi:cell envelope integrity protein TolA [Parashewanella tropica]|uniref:cell envelope integrity protein TolA n=1 Tax=Parashewanella tropica TaxID=2547970 RepID=UPI00105A9C56|nr:cell envelope integrity protein TolA [Parashewanella tropica]